MNRLSKKATDSLFLLAPAWFNRLKAIIFLPVIVAYIGIESYGAFVLIVANLEVLTPFVHMGMGQALVRYTSALDASNKTEIRKGFWTPILAATGFSCILGIGYALAIPSINETLMGGSDVRAVYASIPLLLANALALIVFPYFNSRKRFKEASIYRMLRDLLPYLGLVTGIVLTNDLFAGIVLLVILQYIFLGYLLFKISGETGGVGFDLALLRKYLRYSWPFSATIFSQRNIENIPKYLISSIYGPVALGIYNILLTIMRLILAFNIPFIKFAESHLPKMWDEGARSRASDIINTCTRYYFVIVCCCATLIVMGINDLLEIFFPAILENITMPLIPVMVAFSLFVLLYGINDFSRIFAKLEEKSLLVLSISLAGLTVIAVLAPILVRSFGLTGAALSQLVAALIMQVFYTVSLKTNRPLSSYMYTVKTLIPVLLAGTTYWVVPKQGILTVGMAALAGVCLFVLSTHILKIITLQEVASLGFSKAVQPTD